MEKTAKERALERGKEFINDLPNYPKEEVIDAIAKSMYDSAMEYQTGSLMGIAWFSELPKGDKEYWRAKARHVYNLVCWHKGISCQ